MSDQQLASDKKAFARYWGQAVFGFAGQTPTSAGKHICVFCTTGVAACYDRDGNRQWITRGSGGGSEHGNFASPLLVGHKLVLQPGREYREVARSFLAGAKDGKEQAQLLASPIFEGARMYYRTPGHRCCIGEK